jgi:hypothetical protein
MRPVFVGGIGLLGPGLEGWQNSLPVLAGQSPYQPRPVATAAPALLPPGERRRATMASKLAMQVGCEALGRNGACHEGVCCVFASGSGELAVIDGICRTLLLSDRPVSPTQFHNSVHNAPAGYWSIATSSMEPSLSLSAFDGTFGAGLLDAAITAIAEQRPVLLIAYDVPAPEPLGALRSLTAPFAVALLLHPDPPDFASPGLHLQMNGGSDVPPCTMADPQLDLLRQGNPAARCLPLLQALATGQTAPFRLAAPGAALQVRIVPSSA